MQEAASQLWVSRQVDFLGTTHAKIICNTNFYGHIHVLLIKTNSMIYNMLYKNHKIQCWRLLREVHVLRQFVIPIFMVIFMFYSLKQIQ